MAEVLTESFCERCGTRYTFESAQPRVKRLKGVKVLSRGLKNFVLSDDSSLDEAMAAARSDTDREITAQQLDAFHQTFNFCMTCRQYTCANCWNEAEGSCLTCSPHLGREILPAPFPDLDPTAGITFVPDATETNGNGHEHAPAAAAAGGLALGAWPASDLAAPDTSDGGALEVIDDVEPVDAAARLAALTSLEPVEAASEPVEAASEPTGATAEPILQPTLQAAVPSPSVVEADPAETEIAAAAAVAGIADEAIAGSEPVLEAPAASTDEVAAAAAAQTAALLHRFRPGQNLDAEIEAYEREQAERESAAAAVPDAIIAAAVTQEILAEPVSAEAAATEVEVEAVADAEPIAEPEPVAAEAAQPDDDAAAAAAAAALAAAAVRRTDIVEQPTWQIVAPDVEAPAVSTPPVVPVAPAPNGAPPEWPARPEWPAQAQATNGLPFLGRPAQPTGGLESLWAESSREVAAAPLAPGRPAVGGVQPCVSCGLSLSATARFCRRCGTSQVA